MYLNFIPKISNHKNLDPRARPCIHNEVSYLVNHAIRFLICFNISLKKNKITHKHNKVGTLKFYDKYKFLKNVTKLTMITKLMKNLVDKT